MKAYIKSLLLALPLLTGSCSNDKITEDKQINTQLTRPRLVIGLVIDQMRWDYLYRYMPRYGEGGFKRLFAEGFSCENTSIPYIPTVTAIGHTSIYTGSVPSIHGIAGNSFFNGSSLVYCTDDNTVQPVGTTNKAHKMSPRNLWVTTMGDELRIATNNRAKVVGVALKDRAAILPAGHNPNGAYWFDDTTGHFVTSTYYMSELPTWVSNFNDQDFATQYLSKPWDTLYAPSTYSQSTTDSNNYENGIKPGVAPTLPLDLPTLYNKYGYSIIRSTPFGNSLTFDIAKAAIEGEALGTDSITDLLAVSCSSTDYIGHQVGPNAVETEDTYLRLDRDIAAFLNYLDKKIGKENYLIFITADHGVMNVPQYLTDNNIPNGKWSEKNAKDYINTAIKSELNITGDLVTYITNYQVYFNHEGIAGSKGLDFEKIKRITIQQLEKDSAVLYAVDMQQVSAASIPNDLKERIINGYNRERSGDIQIVLKPGYTAHGMTGADHSAWNPYDSHIPLIFMGWGIKHGATTTSHYMTDIAPTISSLLHIQAPNGCIGQPIF